MKTAWWILVIFSVIGIQRSNAQYVTIPDANFATWLQNNGFSGCMNGNQLDTTCPDVVNDLGIVVDYASITDLEGIQYFDNLLSLYCDHNQLTALPQLPATLVSLYCGSNNITSLGALPPTLGTLDCGSNQLTELPVLPIALDDLTCNNNFLTSLPLLPSTLSALSCYANQLSDLPLLPSTLLSLMCGQNELGQLPMLPPGLLYLDCSSNQLTELPTLPSSLEDLNCGSNQLTSLPTLPSSLVELTCSNNILASLPNIPWQVDALICNDNQLTSLPPLPNQLSFLNASNNQLTSITSLPKALFAFDVENNAQLLCIPPLIKYNGSVFSFSIENTGIKCLPNVIQHSGFIEQIDTMPICGVINLNDCELGWNVLGMVYQDTISDCQQNSEPRLRNLKVVIEQNDSVVEQMFTSYTGQFSFLEPLDSFTVKIDTAGIPFLITCPSTNEIDVILSIANPYDSTSNFGLQCKNGFDLGVSGIVPTEGIFFPGQQASVSAFAGDIASLFGINCNTLGISGTATLIVQGPVTIETTSGNGLVSGNQITWNVTDFSTVNFENDFWLQLTTDTSAQAGDLVCITVTVSASSGTDNYPLNDTLTHCFTVVNSFDPNVKEVYPATVTEPGGWHTYTIHFQNTGTAAAQNIVVKDTLDANLDWTSFQLLAYSHENLTQVLQNGIVLFNFPNINLPDSNSNEPDSHGFIQYRVKTDSTITYGTEIHNTAAIYFDFNEPVITNDALVVYEEPENVSTTFHSTNAFSLYPNPASNEVTIKVSSNTNATSTGSLQALVEVTDLTGKVLFSVSTEKLQTKLSLENLSSGCYFVRLIENDRAIGVKKLAVVK